MNMKKEIDLDETVITPAVLMAWSAHCQKIVGELGRKGLINRNTVISEERAELGPNGELIIFVSIAGQWFDMSFPQGQWQMPKNN